LRDESGLGMTGITTEVANRMHRALHLRDPKYREEQ
jgi:hypothetical protein